MCSSQQSLMVAPMCFRQHSVIRSAVPFHYAFSLTSAFVGRCFTLTQSLAQTASLLQHAPSHKRDSTAHAFIPSSHLKPITQPLFVLACEAIVCVTDFCWHSPTLIYMPRKNPTLSDIWHFMQVYITQTMALATAFTSFIPFKASGHSATAMKYCSHFWLPAAQGCCTLLARHRKKDCMIIIF